jgi:hypothetical protein
VLLALIDNTSYITGIYEFVYGCHVENRAAFINFWRMFGFDIVKEGSLSASDSSALYGHVSPVTSLLLRHPGCDHADGGYVRLQCWDELRNDGVAIASPLSVGSRWMGMYTNDILRINDAFQDSINKFGNRGWWMSNIARAALESPAPAFDFVNPFVGLRELMLLTEFTRMAFIQRVGFDRPGFGTIIGDLPYVNSEGTHANIVQPEGQFNSQFYKDVLGWETAPFGEEVDAGDEPASIAVLGLLPGQKFRMERLKSPYSPTGMLQIYSPYESNGADIREKSCPGSRGLSLYTVKMTNLEEVRIRANQFGATNISEVMAGEFGESTLVFTAPDDFVWSVVEHVE